MIQRHHVTFSNDLKKNSHVVGVVKFRFVPSHTSTPVSHLTQPSSTGSRFKPLPTQVATVGSAVFSHWRFSNNRRSKVIPSWRALQSCAAFTAAVNSESVASIIQTSGSCAVFMRSARNSRRHGDFGERGEQHLRQIF